MAARSSNLLSFWLTMFFGAVALTSMALSVILLFPPRVPTVPFLERNRIFLEFLLCSPCFLFVSTFAYRPRVIYFLRNRNGFLCSPIAAWLWAIAAGMPALTDGHRGRSWTLTGIGIAALLVLGGWLLRGPKEQPAFQEKRDELDGRDMTRLKLV
jgi:hypothetical protein